MERPNGYRYKYETRGEASCSTEGCFKALGNQKQYHLYKKGNGRYCWSCAREKKLI